MGQIVGKPAIVEPVNKFLNLPKEALESIWSSYTLLGEGWGIGLLEFQDIVREATFVSEKLGITESDAEQLFVVFDTDKNGLIDALECIATLCIVSGMDIIDKIYFVFSLYDFDRSSSLPFNAVNLLIKSLFAGYRKISKGGPSLPTDADAATCAEWIFVDAKKKQSEKVSSKEFKEYCCLHPIIRSWIMFMVNVEGAATAVTDESFNVEEIFGKSSPIREFARVKFRDVHPQLSENIAVKRQWFEFVDTKMVPDELPAGATRTDVPEDVLEPVWLHGNCSVYAANNVRYSCRTSTSGRQAVVFPLSNHLVHMQKNEETNQWSQTRSTKHLHSITCFETDASGKLAATADSYVEPVEDSTDVQTGVNIAIWNLKTGECSATFSLPLQTNVRCMDFSADGTLLVVVANDVAGTVYVLQTTDGKLIFSAATAKNNKNTVTTARFLGTKTMFVLGNASAAGAMDFFIDEEDSYMGDGKMRSYTHRHGLHQAMGAAAIGSAVKAITKFEYPEECISGNAAGHLMYWRGRNCMQLLSGHSGSGGIVGLSYSISSKTLVSAGADNVINIYNVLPVTLSRPNRTVEKVASFSFLSCKDVIGYTIASLNLSQDGKTLLLASKSGEVVELSCVGPAAGSVPVPSEEEGGSAAVRKLGDDINGAPIIRAHWNQLIGPATAASEGDSSNAPPVVRYEAAEVTSLCKTTGGFVSAGRDGVVRLWQEAEGAPHAAAKHIVLDSGCQCMAASRAFIAVSFDGNLNSARKGAVHIMGVADLAPLSWLNSHECLVTALQFSVDGNTLVCGGEDGSVSVYSAGDAGVFNSKGRITGHTSSIVAMDVSADGAYLKVLDCADEFSVWDLQANFGTEVHAKEVLKTIQWGNNNCPAGWDVKAAWSGRLQGETITASDRFNQLMVCATSSSSSLSLVRAPSAGFTSLPTSLNLRSVCAHIGGVSAVCFLDEGTKLVSAGAKDGCIAVWSVAFDADEPEPDVIPLAEGEEEAEAAAMDEGEGEEGEDKPKYIYIDSADEEDSIDGASTVSRIARRKKGFESEEAAFPSTPSCSSDSKDYRIAAMSGIGDWVESAYSYALDDVLVTAANTTRELTMVPNDDLTLGWVHGGYACRSTRSSARYSRQGRLLYAAGSKGIIYNKSSHTQNVFAGNNGSICAMDVHIGTGVAASAHLSNDVVYLELWDGDSGCSINRIDCGKVFGASAVQFSPCGDYVAIACLDHAHTIMVFDWKRGAIHARYNGGAKKVLCFAFGTGTAVDSLGNRSLKLLHGGIIHFSIADIKEQNCVNVKTGLYGAGVRKSNVLCVASLPLPQEGGNEFILGLSNGTLGVVARGDKKVAQFASILERGSITALWVCKQKDATAEEGPQYQIVVGCTQGHVKILDMEFQPVSEYNLYHGDLYNLLPIGQVQGIKSLCADKANRKLLIGTAGGELLEIQIQNGDDVNGFPLVQSHCCGKTLGMDTHPNRQECATVGDDKTLRIWDLDQQKQLNRIDLPDIARCVCFASNGFILAAGLGADDLSDHRDMPRENDGKVVVVSYIQNVLRIVHETIDCKEPITCVLFNPDSSVLYAASKGRKICMYDCLNNFVLMGILDEGMTQPIRNMDISEDGKVLSVQGDADELVLWRVDLRSIVPRHETLQVWTETKWVNRRVTIGMDSMGLFPEFGASSDVQCVARSHDQKLMVCGDVWGNIGLFSYPSPLPLAEGKFYKAHSTIGGAAQVAFSAADKYVVSLGSWDRCVMQWKLNRFENKEVDATPAGALLQKRKPKVHIDPISDQQPNTANNFSLNEFTINEVKFAKAEEKASGPIKLSLETVCGANQSIDDRTHTSAFYIGNGKILSYAGDSFSAFAATKDNCQIWSQGSASACKTKEISAVCVSEDARYVFVGTSSVAMYDLDVFARTSRLVGSLKVLDSISGSEYAVIDDSIQGGVECIAVSPCGRYIACTAGDAQHSLHLYYCNQPDTCWSNLYTRKLHSNPVSMRSLLAIAFICQGPRGPTTSGSRLNTGLDVGFGTATSREHFQLVTGGEGHLRFWRLHAQGSMAAAELADHGSSETEGIPITGAISLSPHHTITTDTKGNICFWNGRVCSSSIKQAHPSSITAIAPYGGANTGALTYLTASDDCIKLWNGEVPERTISIIQCLNALNIPLLNKEISSLYTVGSMQVDGVKKRLLLGVQSTSTAVIEMALDSEKPTLITEGNVGKVISLACHPNQPALFVTGSDTGCLKLWEMQPGMPAKCLERHMVDEKISAIQFTADGNIMAISTCHSSGLASPGAKDNSELSSTMLFLSFSPNPFGENKSKLTIVSKLANSGSGVISSLRFSGDGKMLVAATSTPSLFVYALDKNAGPAGYKFLGRVYTANIQRSLDLSTDGRFLRCFSINNDSGFPSDIHFYDLESVGSENSNLGRELVNPEMLEIMKNSTTWCSTSSACVPEGKGIVDYALSSGLKICSVDVSKDLRMIAASFSDGSVQVFRYPCYSLADVKAIVNTANHHSTGGDVSVCFSGDSKKLVSVGTVDGSSFVWSIEATK